VWTYNSLIYDSTSAVFRHSIEYLFIVLFTMITFDKLMIIFDSIIYIYTYYVEQKKKIKNFVSKWISVDNIVMRATNQYSWYLSLSSIDF